jgi:MarR family 2-MHQ and catechol resistance regulon transcriptional repressor
MTMAIRQSQPKKASNVIRSYQLLHEAYVLSDACDNQALVEFGLTVSQFRLLSLLHNEQGRRLTELSQQLLLSKSAITRAVDQLEALGFAMRAPDPHDRRAQRVVLTPQGAGHLAQALAKHVLSLSQRTQDLSRLELDQLILLLDKLCQGLRCGLGAGP